MILRNALLIAVFAAWSVASHAQKGEQLPRVGFISSLTPAAMNTRVQAFRQGLKERGYVEGKNIVVEYLWGYGQRNPDELAAEMLKLKPHVIVTGGPGHTRRFKAAKTAIPVVMAYDPDPVSSGFVASLARPGGNITGLSSVAPEVSRKQLDILKQILPALSHIGVLGDSVEPGNELTKQEVEKAASSIGAKVTYLNLREYKRIDDAFEALRGRADALIIVTNAIVVARKPQLARLAVKSRIPVMYPAADFVDEGGLITYSANVEDLFRRSAIYVDRILKGGKPAEMAVEQPYKFDLVINLRAAEDIGMKIPMSVLSRADKVIQ